jgi:curved DNA-binding protein CbpA
MKRYQEANYYELLEISREATLHQIRTAYYLAKKTFGQKSLGTLSLFSDEERGAIWAKIEEAYAVLSDIDKRRRYDGSLENGGVPSPPEDFAEKGGAPVSPSPLPDEISGAFLKSIREGRNVTLESLISHTRIAINYLIAIESDQYRHFPPEVYLKSYLTEYAKFLNLDAKKLVDGYLKYYRIHRHASENQARKK